jgi:AAA domain (dynein-related subfamily)
MMRHPWIQNLAAVLIIFSALQLIGHFFGWTVLLVVVVLAGLTGAVAWMATHDRARLAKLYTRPGCKPFIDLVCRSIDKQPPVAGRETEPDPELLLRDAAAFTHAKRCLTEVVRGHDAAIERILDALQKKVVLRMRGGNAGGHAPLGIFVLAGPSGFGKRHLASQLGRLVYRKETVLHLDLAEHPDGSPALASLFGCDPMSPGRLVAAVKAEPYQTVVLDNVEAAPPEVLDRLAKILARGQWSTQPTSPPVSFRHCVFALVCSACPSSLWQKTGVDQGAAGPDDPKVIAETLAAETPLGPQIISRADQVLVLSPLELLARAEVVALLMKKHCATNKLALGDVAPEAIVELVAGVSDAHGFTYTPTQVGKRLLDPLVRAARAGHSRVDVPPLDSSIWER